MLTTKNWAATAFLWTLILLAAFTGQACKRSASTQLLEGERLVQQGRHAEAIDALQSAIPGLRTNALAHAWNNLGLAFHGSGKPLDAMRAYQQAISIDRNLAAPRFNLGSLLLEQGELGGAINELTTYTVLNPQSGEGWAQLGNALLEARRPDDAERAFRAALNLKGQTPEILTGLGVAYAQRKKAREAVQSFSAALQRQPTYGPAMFNLASAQHEFFRNTQAARALFQDYVATQPPTAPHLSAAREWAARLEEQLERRALLTTNAPAAAQAPSTNVAATPPPSRPMPTNVVAASEPPPVRAPETNRVIAMRANSPLAPEPAVRSGNDRESAAVSPAPAANETSEPPRRAEPPRAQPPAPPAKVEVVRLPAEEPLPPAKDVLPARPPQNPATAAAPTNAAPAGSTNAQLAARSDTRPAPPPLITKPLARPQEDKRGLIEKVNPANWFRRDKPDTEEEKAPAPSKELQVAASQKPAERLMNFPEPAPRPRPRYRYANPARLPAGNRELAARKVTAAYEAHRERRWEEAIQGYQEAIKADPSYYEAHLNLSIAAYQTRRFDLALQAAERAILANPDGVAAREQMALCLENAGFHVDAAEQLMEALKLDERNARAHLQLANLYAQELNAPTAAKTHYRKVLQLEPQHPRATEIRYWLNAHP